MTNDPRGYWFKAKLYGWGWTPVTWQGWVVLLVYVVALGGLSFTIDKTAPTNHVLWTFIALVALLTVCLIAICYKTGERPRWQWGPPKK